MSKCSIALASAPRCRGELRNFKLPPGILFVLGVLRIATCEGNHRQGNNEPSHFRRRSRIYSFGPRQRSSVHDPKIGRSAVQAGGRAWFATLTPNGDRLGRTTWETWRKRRLHVAAQDSTPQNGTGGRAGSSFGLFDREPYGKAACFGAIPGSFQNLPAGHGNRTQEPDTPSPGGRFHLAGRSTSCRCSTAREFS